MACLETFGTLRIFSPTIAPEDIGAILGLKPTKMLARDPLARARALRDVNCWQWCTRGLITSTDPQQHLCAILDFVSPGAVGLGDLQKRDCHTDIFFYWISSGQGGPSLEVDTMQELVNLKLPISWDMYFGKNDEHRSDT